MHSSDHRQQLETISGSKYDGFVKSIRSIFQSEGLSGFWKGNLPASYLYLTFGGTQFCIYYELDSSIENKFLLGGINCI